MCVSAACLREGLRHIRQTNVSCLLVRLSPFSTIYFLFFLMLLFTFLHSLFFPLLSSFLFLFSLHHYFVLPYYTFSALCMQPSLWFWHRLFSCLLFLFFFFFFCKAPVVTVICTGHVLACTADFTVPSCYC